MAKVAQLVEPQIVDLVVAGSCPVFRPNFPSPCLRGFFHAQTPFPSPARMYGAWIHVLGGDGSAQAHGLDGPDGCHGARETTDSADCGRNGGVRQHAPHLLQSVQSAVPSRRAGRCGFSPPKFPRTPLLQWCPGKTRGGTKERERGKGNWRVVGLCPTPRQGEVRPVPPARPADVPDWDAPGDAVGPTGRSRKS